MNKIKHKYSDELKRKTNIIEAIINGDTKGVEVAISESPLCVNSIHETTGMNTAMLAAFGRFHSALALILEQSYDLDYTHIDLNGDDLIDHAMQSLDAEVMKAVIQAYESYAPHLINNLPTPNNI